MITEKHTSAWEGILMLGDGLIPATRIEYLKKHLQECKECQAQLESLEKMTAALPRTEGTAAREPGSARTNTSRYDFGQLGKLSRSRVFLALGVLAALAAFALSLWNGSVRHGLPTGSVKPDALQMAAQSSADYKLLKKERSEQTFATMALSPSPMIVRSVSLSIITKDFAATRASLETILARHRGYAADLTVNTEQNSPRSLQASLRIPAGELAVALAELKALGVVENESQKGEEVTQQHSDLVARLKNSRETEQRLLTILQQRTGKMSDVLEVEQEISRVRGEIEGMEAEQKSLEHRVDFATVDLHVREEYRAQLGAPSLSNRFRNAVVGGFQSAADMIVAILLWLLNYGPTLLLWLAILFLPMRFIWRRSKAALGRGVA